jgi:hypothetical protein
LFGEAHSERASIPHEWYAKQERFVDELFEPPIVRKSCVLESELEISLGFSIDELIEPEFLHEAPELSERRRSLVQIDKMRLDSTLGEESERFACVRALFHAEDLNFHQLHQLVIDRDRISPAY